jgi:hypothetical protein
MHIVLVAHTHIKTFKNPEGDDFDRYELKLHIKAGGLLKEWCDDVLFAHYETYAVNRQDEKKAKGFSTGARVVETVRTAAWDAKNRHKLPRDAAARLRRLRCRGEGAADAAAEICARASPRSWPSSATPR